MAEVCGSGALFEAAGGNDDAGIGAGVGIEVLSGGTCSAQVSDHSSQSGQGESSSSNIFMLYPGPPPCLVNLVQERNNGVQYQPPVSDPVELGGDTTLQCSILTDASAGDHSVYWFRHGSGESHPGIIYTHGNRSDECKKSSETDSPTQSCVYKLPKRNLSLSDAGTYYCAVLLCGEIIFGNGTKLDFAEKGVLDPTLLVLAASNIMSIAVVLFLCRKLHKHHHKGAAEGRTINQAEDTDALNYAALSFAQSSSSRRSRTKNSSDQPVYAQVKTHQ
ncbi:uncharacterized protein LOC119264816 [Pygocentrus nattereri]|uniref:uncharacterized protein LOC119264816 n=1 Tax=Pygocentrus nattereri TaxID=42514 RepID=UPI001890F4C8|nr:uncharacterized protein LOC119264816 [Pygocentrus nattereri]